MDIQKIITDVLKQLDGNEELVKKFTADPVKTLEKILKVDLPDEQLNAVIEAVKAKINLDDTIESAKNIFGAVKNIFGK